MIGLRKQIRLAIACSLVLCPLTSASQRAEDSVEPTEPRQGAAFAYADSPPSITLEWKGPEEGCDYLLHITRESAGGEIVSTHEIYSHNSFTFQATSCGRFSWWVTSLDPDGQPVSRPVKIMIFIVQPASRKPGSVTENRQRPESSSQTGRPGRENASVRTDPLAKSNAGRQILPRKKQSPGGENDKVSDTMRGEGKAASSTKVKKPIPGAGSRASGASPTVNDDSPSPRYAKVKDEGLAPAVAEADSHVSDDDKPVVLRFPAAPGLEAPENGAQIVATRPRTIRLFWQRIWEAEEYEVELARSVDFDPVVSRRKAGRPLLEIRNPPRGRVFWRVRAIDAKESRGKWSTSWHFVYKRLFDD